MRRHLCVMALVATSVVHGAAVVRDSVVYRPEGSDYVIVRGDISLPAEGYWEVAGSASAKDVVQLYLLAPVEGRDALLGQRMGAVMKDKRIKQGGNHLHRLYWPCSQYARQHDGLGPSTLSDLDSSKRRIQIRETVSKSPWGKEIGMDVEGPFIFLLPDVEFHFEPDARRRKRVRAENRRVLAVELRPYVEDGKHWVLYTDQSRRREAIDPELVKKYNLRIRPVLAKEDLLRKPPTELSYKIIAVRLKDAPDPISLSLANVITDTRLSVDWDPSDARPEQQGVLADLKRARRAAWEPYASSPVLSTWLASYGDKSRAASARPRPRRGRRRASAAFGIMGGRAAVRETLQMQVLAVAPERGQPRTIPVSTLKGVEVKSHPYEQMLKRAKGGELALANVAPHDHFFVYVAKPWAIVSFLDRGAEFMSRFGGALTNSSIKYDLKARHLARLGLNEEWMRAFLKSGAVSECALIFPDLFFIDGTDVTVVSRLAQPKLIAAMLKLVGVTQLSTQDIVTIDLADGGRVHWALRHDLLFISTSHPELDQVLSLHKAAGRGSLGHSAEFRYMLTQLPVKRETRLYAYFSDPFVRHLVGPETKLAQLRRVQARADMEYLTSCALLAKLDGIAGAASLQTLASGGYVRDRYVDGDYSIDQNLVVRSNTYGALSSMKALSPAPVDKVTQVEADSYKAYVENYARYWRRFFDPIAVRVDDAPDGSLEATTFILPLIDNSIYNALKASLSTREDAVVLKTPEISPRPVLMLSVNLGEKGWRELLREGMSEALSRYSHVSPAVLDDLGPSLHLAIHDADPVIALGSGDMLGIFNANMLGRRNEMLFIPVVLSVLTRPCTLIVETRDPVKTRQFLRQSATAALKAPRRGREVRGEFFQIENRDAWVFALDIMGIAKLRYGLEIQGNFVMIRNIPWSNKDKIVSVDQARLNGAKLQAFPGGCKLQLPGLHTAASDGYRSAAVQGMAYLYPLVASGHATVGLGAEKHAALFGFRPVHPGDGQWLWQSYQLASSRYGSPRRQRQPGYSEGDRNFGLMKDIEHLSINMQFEDTGLRTAIRWKTR